MSENIGTFLANVEKWSQSSELCLYSPSGEGLVKEGRKEGGKGLQGRVVMDQTNAGRFNNVNGYGAAKFFSGTLRRAIAGVPDVAF